MSVNHIRRTGGTVRCGTDISGYLRGKRYSLFFPVVWCVILFFGIMQYGIRYMAQCFCTQALPKPKIQNKAIKPTCVWQIVCTVSFTKSRLIHSESPLRRLTEVVLWGVKIPQNTIQLLGLPQTPLRPVLSECDEHL